MFRIRFAFCMAACITASGAATAANLSPEQSILARQAALEMSAVTFGEMKRGAASGAEARTQGFYAGALASWARVLPWLFPAGTADGATSTPTEAKAEIWTNRADFDAKAAAYLAATNRLVDLSKVNDTAGFQAQLAVVKETCAACHRSYQARGMGD